MFCLKLRIWRAVHKNPKPDITITAVDSCRLQVPPNSCQYPRAHRALDSAPAAAAKPAPCKTCSPCPGRATILRTSQVSLWPVQIMNVRSISSHTQPLLPTHDSMNLWHCSPVLNLRLLARKELPALAAKITDELGLSTRWCGRKLVISRGESASCSSQLNLRLFFPTNQEWCE